MKIICVILCFHMEIAASQMVIPWEAGRVIAPLAPMVIKELAKVGIDFAKEQWSREMDSTLAEGQKKSVKPPMHSKQSIVQYVHDNIHFMCDDNAAYLYQQIEAMKLTKEFQEYDVEINREGRTLKAIGNVGWQYTINDKKRFRELRKSKQFKAFFVCILGEFNQGKTWLINLLSDRWFEFGFDQVTKSIGCVLPKAMSQIVYCDSPGTSRAVHIDDLNDRVGTDRIIEETMISFSDMLLLVCGPLTTTVQLRHRKYIDRVSEISGKRERIVYIIHNWKNFYTFNQVEIFIKSDIIDAYGAEKRELKNHTFYFHIDNQTGLEIIHIIFAAEGSRAGMHWNNGSLLILKDLIENLGQSRAMHTFEIIKEFKAELEPLLRETFTTRDAKNGTKSRNESVEDVYWHKLLAPVRCVKSVGNSISEGIKFVWSKMTGSSEVWEKGRLDLAQPSSDKDPYKLEVKKDILVMKNPHSLEYFESSEIGGIPVPFYKPTFGIYVSNNTWEIQIRVFGYEWWQFSGIMVFRENNNLIVEGNILKPDRVKEQHDDGQYVFDILTETRRFGYFRMPFELHSCVNRDQCMKNGEIGWYDAVDNPDCAWKKSLQSGTLIITAAAKGCKK